MKYEKPTVEIINIENEDVIVASIGNPRCYGSNGNFGQPNNTNQFLTTFRCVGWGIAEPCVLVAGNSCVAIFGGGTCTEQYGGVN